MIESLVGFVFCGGKGTRLMPYTKDIPKPILLSFNGKSFLEINIEKLLNLGATHIYVNHTYGYEHFSKIVERYKDKVTLIEELQPNGHGKTLCNLLSSIGDTNYIYTINGDTISYFDYSVFLNNAKEQNIDFQILTSNDIKVEKNILVDENNNILGCKLKEENYYYTNKETNLSLVNSLGENILKVDALKEIYQESLKQDFLGIFGENDLLEILIKNRKTVKAIPMNIQSYISVNTIEEYNNFYKYNNA